ncbi:hypothetical protein [Hydrococcus rivularis]|nr:hypothetical protein [Hydrococcus rivularis]
MLLKNLKVLIRALPLLSLGAILSAPVLADPTTQQIPTFDRTHHLLSQLRGHDTYKGESQLEFSDYLFGTVVGQTGDILSVKLEDGRLFSGTHPNRYLYRRVNKVGADVLVEEEDGEYRIVDFAHPNWIGELEQNYNLRR